MIEKNGFLSNLNVKKQTFFYFSLIPAMAEVFLLLIPFMNFFDKFIINGIDDKYLVSVKFDFFAFFILFSISNFIILFSNKHYLNGFCFLGAVTSGSLALYRYSEIFTIKIFFLIVLLLTLGIKFSFKKSFFLSFFYILIFTIILHHPKFLGTIDVNLDELEKTFNSCEKIEYFAIIILTLAISFLYRYIVNDVLESHAIANHLNQSMTQMTAFNQELQEYAKNRGGEAAQMERLRITRDLHDSCGYVFVNIMCLMEACCSVREMEWGRVKETFETVRGLASHGLQETRKTLRTIREIQNPMENGLDSLYEIKRIFQNVTKIKVTLDKGNMKNDYGPAVNKILVRTMQEGLTNSVRHGRATEVSVDFRDDGENLFMTVIDNGIGSKQVIKGIGLAGMEERLNVLGGELKTSPGIEGGFKLEIKIPIIQTMMENYEKSKVDAG